MASLVTTFPLFLLFAITTIIVAQDLCLDGDCNNDGEWDTNAWYAQVDGVMGGKSTGSLDFVDDDSTMLFSGRISLDGGGFSSVRRSFLGRIIDLTPYAGIVVTMESQSFDSSEDDDVPLAMHLQFGDSTPQRWRFAAAFTIPLSSNEDDGDGTTSVFIPLENFDRGSRTGFVCQNGCALDATKVNSMDLYVLFQEGNFRVKIQSITAVEEAVSFSSPQISFDSEEEIVNLLTNTISSGAALYGYAYYELCASVYWSTLSTLLESPSTSEGIKGVICAGLLHTTTQKGQKVNSAWTLRHTIDAILEDLQNGSDSREPEFDWLPVGSDALPFADQCRGITSVASDAAMFSPVEESADNEEDNDEDGGELTPQCFPEHALIQEITKGVIPMKHLEIGDSVLDASGSFSQVYGFGHKDTLTSNVEYLELSANHHDDGSEVVLPISSNHFIFVLSRDGSKKRVSIRGGDVEIGDTIFLEIDGTPTTVVISKISMTYNSTGAYAPFTYSGTLLVNQIAVSSYATYSAHISHELAHWLLAPRRWLCRMVMESWCQMEEYTPNEGIATWIPLQMVEKGWELIDIFW